MKKKKKNQNQYLKQLKHLNNFISNYIYQSQNKNKTKQKHKTLCHLPVVKT